MKIFHKWIVLITLLLAALMSYSVGFSQGIIFFIALGLVLEFAFWFGALSKKKIHTDHSHDQTNKVSYFYLKAKNS